MRPRAAGGTALVAGLVLALAVSCRGRDTASVAEMKAQVAALEKERDALRIKIGESVAKDERIQGMPTTGVRVGVPTTLARDLMTRVITGFVDQVTLRLGNIKVHKAGKVKKVISIGEYVLDVRIVEVTGRLQTGTPKLRFGGNEIGLDLPVRVASGTGTATIDFAWDGKNVSGAVCGDMQIRQTVSGKVKPADYPVTGAVTLTATAQQILAAPKLPRVKVNIKVDPTPESWSAVQQILDSKEGLCGYVVDKVNILGILEKLLAKGFNVRLPTEKIKPMAVPVGIAPTMTVRDREVTIAVEVSQLAITPHMIWLGADVKLDEASPTTGGAGSASDAESAPATSGGV